MRTLALPLAIGVLLAAAALVLVTALTPSADTTVEGRVERLAAGLRCPDCQALSVAESRTAAANAIREEIAAQVADGRSDAQVRAHFVERYGEWILLSPSDPLAWWLPPVVLLAALTGFAAWWRSARRGRPVAAAAPDPAAESDRRRVRDELEALDG